MKSRRASRIVFAIPELAQAVFAFVSRRDLPRCMRVCKEWFQHAEPHLWTHYSPRLPRNRSMLSPPATEALIKNLPRLRSVELKSQEFSVLQPLTVHLQPGISVKAASDLCTHLRRFKLECYKNVLGLRSPPIVKLLNHNLQLTHLTLPFVALTMDDTIFVVISNLRCLRHLTLGSIKKRIGTRYSSSGTRTIPLLLQACLPLSELTELHLDLDMVWDDTGNETGNTDVETIIREAATARFLNPAASKIKSLRLPTCHEGSKSPLPIPFLRSSLLDLESFMIPRFSDEDTDPQEVEKIVRKYCPGLRHVSCQCEEDAQDGRFIRAFLQGSSGLQSFTSDGFSDQRQICNDQEMFPSFEPRWIISQLLAHHHNTLEDFELTNCSQVWSEDLQAILSRCNRLKRFWVGHHDRASKPGIDVTDVSGGDWVCMGLRELRLTLNRHLTAEDGHASPEQIAQAAKHVYTQIGRLDQLEILALDIDRSEDMIGEEDDFPWDLTLSKGWLSEMSGLKNLKMLRLFSDFWSKMGQAEVEFMREHWPLLSEIRLYGDNHLHLHTALLWQWPFDKQRPQAWFNDDIRLWYN